RMLADLQKKQAGSSNNPSGVNHTADKVASPGSAPANNSVESANHQGDFEASMQLGAITPAEIVFTASLAMGSNVEKLDRDAPPPANNHLEADFKGKPFRTYTVNIHADARALKLNREADGLRHGSVEFVTVVYDQVGNRVNSLITTAELNLNDDSYRKLLTIGLPAEQQIAV